MRRAAVVLLFFIGPAVREYPKIQIGWVIVGGLLLGTVFTLFVIPTAYLLLARKKVHEVSAPSLETEAVNVRK